MSKRILAGLERLEEEPVAPAEGEVVETPEEVVELMEDVEEAEAADDELEVEEEKEEAGEASIETLLHIHNMISTHGISKPMMEMADPTGELAEAGIVPASEGLENVPVKNGDAVTALEGLGEQLKKAWDAMIAFLKKMAAVVVGWFNKFLQMFLSYEKVLAGLHKKFAAMKGFDSTKAKEVKVTVAPILKDHGAKATLAIKKAVAVVDSLKTADLDPSKDNSAAASAIMKAVADVDFTAMGFKASFENNTVSLSSAKGEGESVALAASGYNSPGSVASSIKAILDTLVSIKKVKGVADELEKGYKKVASEAEKKVREVNKKDSAELKAFNENLKNGKNILKNVQTTAKAAVIAAKRLSAGIVSIANAATKAAA